MKDYFISWCEKQEEGMSKLSDVDISLLSKEELDMLIQKLKKRKNQNDI